MARKETPPLKEPRESTEVSPLAKLDREIAAKERSIRAAKEAAQAARATAAASAKQARSSSAGKKSGRARSDDPSARLRNLDQEISRRQGELRETRAKRKQAWHAERAKVEKAPAAAVKPSEPKADEEKARREQATESAPQPSPVDRAARGARVAFGRARKEVARRGRARAEQRARARRAALKARRAERPVRAPAPVASESRQRARPTEKITERPSRLGRRLAIAGVVLAIPAVGLGAGALSADDSPAAPSTAPPNAEDTSYVEELEREAKDLAAARRDDLGRLNKADTPAEQAAAAESLANSHRAAAKAFAAITVPDALRASRQALVAACTSVARDYERLASAAGDREEKAYGDAQRAVRDAERDLANQMRQLARQET